METKLKGIQLYIGDKPINISESTQVQLAEDYSIEAKPWPQGFSGSLTVDLPQTRENQAAFRELFYNCIIPYWQANHRGNSFHYISYWHTVYKYLNGKI